MAKKIPRIHKNMLVSDIISLYPETSEIIMNYGLHCIGCYYNAFETLEQGILGHGYSKKELNKLIAELNEFVSIKQKPNSRAKLF